MAFNESCTVCGCFALGRVGDLVYHSDEPYVSECYNCKETRETGIFTVSPGRPRTDKEIIRMVATLVVDGDVEIPHLTKRLEELCDPEGEPVDGYWLHHETKDSFEDWCWECALLLRDYFNGKTDKPETVWDGERIPTWPQAEDSVEINGGWATDSDSSCHCARCGKRVDFCPTSEFTEIEMEYFEEHGVKEDWWSFRIFLEAALDYSKEPDWYARVVLLAHKWVPLED